MTFSLVGDYCVVYYCVKEFVNYLAIQKSFHFFHHLAMQLLAMQYFITER